MPPPIVAYKKVFLIPKLRKHFAEVPSTSFSQAPKYTLLIHLCRFRVRSYDGAISWNLFVQVQSIKNSQLTRSVTTIWLRNINLISIDYGFRPRLRCRLTLRGLTLRRNPWIFGEEVFHSLSLLMSAFALLIPPGSLTGILTGLQNVPLPVMYEKLQNPDSVYDFSPRYIFGAETLLDR